MGLYLQNANLPGDDIMLKVHAHNSRVLLRLPPNCSRVRQSMHCAWQRRPRHLLRWFLAPAALVSTILATFYYIYFLRRGGGGGHQFYFASMSLYRLRRTPTTTPTHIRPRVELCGSPYGPAGLLTGYPTLHHHQHPPPPPPPTPPRRPYPRHHRPPPESSHSHPPHPLL